MADVEPGVSVANPWEGEEERCKPRRGGRKAVYDALTGLYGLSKKLFSHSLFDSLHSRTVFDRPPPVAMHRGRAYVPAPLSGEPPGAPMDAGLVGAGWKPALRPLFP
jgi:hypothetical protein